MSRGSNYRFPRAGVSGVSESMFPRNILKVLFYFIFHGLFNILDRRKNQRPSTAESRADIFSFLR